MTVELEVFNVLVDEAPSDEGHQIQKADGVEARVPSIDLLRLEHSLLALENVHVVLCIIIISPSLKLTFF